MKFTAEIFEFMRRGGFLSANSRDDEKSKWWQDLDNNFGQYEDFYRKLGYCLKKNQHYAHFGRDEKVGTLEERGERLLNLFLLGNAMKFYDAGLSSGQDIDKRHLLEAMETDSDFVEASAYLAEGKASNDKIADTLIAQMCRYGFAECVNERTGKYMVTGAFKYVEDLVELVKINDYGTSE